MQLGGGDGACLHLRWEVIGQVYGSVSSKAKSGTVAIIVVSGIHKFNGNQQGKTQEQSDSWIQGFHGAARAHCW